MVGGNYRNQFRQFAGQNVRNQNRYNAVQNVGNQIVQNSGIQNVRNWNGLIVVPRIANENANQNGNGNVVAARAKGNGNRNNKNQLQAEEFDLMAAVRDLDEIDVEQSGGTVEQHHAIVEETRALYDSLYNNLAIEVEKVNKQAQQKQQSLYNGKVLLEKHDPLVVYDSEETLQLAQEKVFVSQKAKSREELHFSNISKMASVSKSVSKSISIPNEEFSADTSPSVAQKFLNEVKSTIVTLQRVVKQKMTLDIHIWSSSAHQELHKIVKDENFPIVNQVEARVQNFEIHFLKEEAKCVRDFKSLAKEADESLAKHKALEHEIKRLLRAVVSHNIMSIVQNPSVVDTFDLQTELKRIKERLENCIIKKETEYAKFGMIGTKNLGDLKGKSKDTPCVSNTLDPLSQKLENENVELEFQVLNYAKENEHLKTTYKKLFDSINVTRTQTKTIIGSLSQLFDKVSEQQDTIIGTSLKTKFTRQSILGKPPSSFKSKIYYVTPFPNSKVIPKVGKTNALLKPVTSNSAPSTRELKVVKNDNVLAPGLFRINPSKTSKVDNVMTNKPVKASVRTKRITTSQPYVITKKDVNSNSNGLSSTGADNTTKTRRPQPRSNTKKDRVPFASKSSYVKNKEFEVEEHHRNLLLSKNKKHMLSECNNIKLVIRNDKSEVICAIANVSKIANQKKHKPKVTKPKNVWSKERLVSPKPSKPRICLRWSPTGRMFDLKGKIIASSESECQSDSSRGDNACTSNP
ncbi:hypothetical protein Tco_0702236 [Tanacetum coccineum]|uniref:Uncharacterized protein n=1 Tax=Tanacetum coccineum TaxID=301880 RepID=A0ABQ4XWG0_9ASTR